MSVLKRAYLYILRNWKKTAILFLIIFIVSMVVSIGIGIKNGIAESSEVIKKSIGLSATFVENKEKIDELVANDDYKELESMKYPSVDTIKKVGTLGEVAFYDYSISSFTNVDKLKIPKYSGEDYSKMFPYLEFTGINNSELVDIQTNLIKLVEGSLISSESIESGENEAIVSKKLAQLNNLSVGDTLVVDAVFLSNVYPDRNETEDIILTIVGLYEIDSFLEGNDHSDSEERINNILSTIYVPNETSLRIMKQLYQRQIEAFPENFEAVFESQESRLSNEEVLEVITSDVTPDALFYIESPDKLESFIKKVNIILEEYPYIKLLTSIDKYEKISSPLSNLNKISNYVIIGSIIFAVLILITTFVLFLRDRRQELGIQLAMGESAGKLVIQLIVEISIIAILSSSLALFTGMYTSTHIAGSILNVGDEIDMGHTHNDNEYEEIAFDNLDRKSMIENDVIETYKVKIDIRYAVKFYFIIFIIILVTVAVSSIYLFRLTPKNILM